jgi:carbon-monoxide dehydrogenase medium subunit
MLDPFEYHRPETLPAALRLLQSRKDGVKVLAGGTDLLVRMKEGTVRPHAVLDIGDLDELRGIRIRDESVWIGPLTTHREMAISDLIRTHGQALAQGAASVGSPQIRHRATIGGNVVNASPAADTVPPLIALGAEVQISSTQGDRWVSMEAFFSGPGQTILGPGELVTGLRFPVATRGRRMSRYEKLGTRRALSVAVASVAAAALLQDSGELAQVRIALGSVGPIVLRAEEAERLLMGRVPEEDIIDHAVQAARDQCCPIDDIRGSAWYRRQMAAALLNRILQAWMVESR